MGGCYLASPPGTDERFKSGHRAASGLRLSRHVSREDVGLSIGREGGRERGLYGVYVEICRVWGFLNLGVLFGVLIRIITYWCLY